MLSVAVIASEAKDKSQNRLDTGTISFSDIENKADYQVSSSSAGVSSSGMPSMPTSRNKNESEHSTTHSAVSEGTIIIRNKDDQKQDINELSRDTEQANNELKHIFNKQKEQDIIDQTQLVSEIGGETLTMLNHIDRIRAESKAKEAVEKEQEKAADKGIVLTDKQQQKIYEDAYKESMNQGMSAMGSDTRQGIDMAVSIINGLISGDMTGAAAGALAPKIATIIKQHTEGDIVANTVSHAILGAVVAELQGNSALVGGLGAAASERGAEVIMGILYPGKTVAELSQEERQQISALSQLATGLAIAAAGGDIQDVNTGVAAGKNAVENNFLGPKDQHRLEELRNKRNKGFLTQQEKIEMFMLDELDQKGDYLVGKYYKDPNSLTEAEVQQLAVSLSRYYQQVEGMSGEEAARQSVNDLLTGNWGYRSHNYDYPYLGTKEQQEQYNDAYRESIANKSLLEKLFSSRAMDENEEYYREQYNIQKYLQATEWERQVGRPVMNFLPGGVGFIYNTMDTVESASALFDVTKRLNNGEEFSTEMAMKLIDAGFTFIPVAVSKSIPRGAGKGKTTLTPPIKINVANDFTKSPQSIWGRSADDIAKDFQAAGYQVNVRQSTRGSGKAVIIEVKGHPEISQIQIHPGGGRHGGSYYKVSTTTQGTIKVVDPNTYKPSVGEKSIIINKPKR
ncbi:VENN motif pre-toxin domain-containing protein [Gilliamella sp. Bif1-4]|uniref:VENN motif pre-toxin domain-containing protein n=2 Tax=Gilliamella sp. Bif1-4 TaxID=3120233 RepID=UPI0011465F7D|nr:VENN motif pre-toxin domain-containing protein [Gilliamella apicola]